MAGFGAHGAERAGSQSPAHNEVEEEEVGGEPSVRLFPRRKAGEVKSKGFRGRAPAVITLKILSKYFGMPQLKACQELEISLATMKRVCRKFGVTRWPGISADGHSSSSTSPSVSASPSLERLPLHPKLERPAAGSLSSSSASAGAVCCSGAGAEGCSGAVARAPSGGSSASLLSEDSGCESPIDSASSFYSSGELEGLEAFGAQQPPTPEDCCHEDEGLVCQGYSGYTPLSHSAAQPVVQEFGCFRTCSATSLSSLAFTPEAVFEAEGPRDSWICSIEPNFLQNFVGCQ